MTATTHSTEDPESELISLLGDLQTELAAALKSLGGKYPRAIGDRYHLNAGGYINRAAEGYLLLRTRGRIDASKLLIRPAIEAMIRVQALRNSPELLYDIAYSEALEDKKWFRPAAARRGIELSEEIAPQWEKFETAYKAQFPNAPMTKHKFTLYAAAEAAGLLDYYNTYYRMYCQYAHAALRATGGYLDELADPEDTRVMIFCTYCALCAAAEIGGASPNLKSLHSRVDDLSKRGPIKLVRGRAEQIAREATWPLPLFLASDTALGPASEVIDETPTDAWIQFAAMMPEFLRECSFAVSLDRKDYDRFFQSGTSRADFLLFDKATVCEVKEIRSLDIEKQVKNLAGRGRMPTDVFNRYFCNSIIKALRKANDQITGTKQALSCAGALGLIVLENCIPEKMSALTLASVANQTMNAELSAINGILYLDFVNYFESQDGDKVRPCQLLLRPTEEALTLSRPCEVIVEQFCKHHGIPFRRGFNLDSADQLWRADPAGTYQKYTASVTFK